MSELFDEENEKVLVAEDDILDEAEDIIEQDTDLLNPMFDARRRLENLLDAKRLRDELEDFLDYEPDDLPD